jgi:filamentous hemagglutinin
VDGVAVVDPNFASTGAVDFVNTANVVTGNINPNSIALGTDTTGGYAASVSEAGPATTATALAANGANCAAGQYPLGVDASGAVESCTVAAGSGTVTNAGGDLTANSVVLGAGTVDTKVVAGILTDGVGKVTLGVAGTTVGSVDFKNATSGTVTVAPVTGALGTVTISLPASTGTVALTNGNIATATAIAANPTDCAANQFANAIAASGDLTCGAIADADVPDTITVSSYLPLAGGTMTGLLTTNNLGVEFTEGDTNPTCAAGNYNIFADTSEVKLKKCTNGVASDLDTTGAGIGGTVGTTDNAIPRADQTGGSTLQASGCTINDSDRLTCPGGFVAGTAGVGVLTLLEGTAPGAGTSAGEHNCYIDSADSLFKCHENAGSVVVHATTAGNIATATALAANGGNCSGNNFALGVDASGVGECAQPAFSNLSGSATDAQIPDTITASNYLPLTGGTLTGQLVTDNLGIEFDESDTNPTCAVGNYNIYADQSENKLKKCINGSATDLDTTGGTPSFDTITGGTNTTAAMVVGTGGSLVPSGTGTITASGVAANAVAMATDTTGVYVAAITGGAGITSSGGGAENATVTLTSDSTEQAFLAAGALTCGAATNGKILVHTTPLQYCDNAATPALQYSAYADSSGNALAGDTATAFFSAGTLEVARGGTGIGAFGTGVATGLGNNTNGAGGFTTTDGTKTLTGTTLDAEGTGNVITIPKRIWLPAAGCNNATAGPVWDLPTTNAAVAACVTGTNTQKGVLDFADASNLSAQITYKLPSTWAGAVDLNIKWFTTATTGDVVWQSQTICVADAETDDPAFNTADAFAADTAKGTTNQTNDVSDTGITMTGCAAGELLHLKIFRDSAHASDTLAATARLIGVELVVREAI